MRKLGLVVNAILNLEEDRFGSGRHLWDVKGDDFTEYAKVCPTVDPFRIIISNTR